MDSTIEHPPSLHDDEHRRRRRRLRSEAHDERGAKHPGHNSSSSSKDVNGDECTVADDASSCNHQDDNRAVAELNLELTLSTPCIYLLLGQDREDGSKSNQGLIWSILKYTNNTLISTSCISINETMEPMCHLLINESSEIDWRWASWKLLIPLSHNKPILSTLYYNKNLHIVSHSGIRLIYFGTGGIATREGWNLVSCSYKFKLIMHTNLL